MLSLRLPSPCTRINRFASLATKLGIPAPWHSVFIPHAVALLGGTVLGNDRQLGQLGEDAEVLRCVASHSSGLVE